MPKPLFTYIQPPPQHSPFTIFSLFFHYILLIPTATAQQQIIASATAHCLSIYIIYNHSLPRPRRYYQAERNYTPISKPNQYKLSCLLRVLFCYINMNTVVKTIITIVKTTREILVIIFHL